VVPAQRFSPAAEEAMHKFAWVPFGAGPRMCMGANFAMLSTTLAFATLMSKHRFTAVKDRGAVFPIEYDITMHFPGNVEMEISRR
jgi:cytochrome P450